MVTIDTTTFYNKLSSISYKKSTAISRMNTLSSQRPVDPNQQLYNLTRGSKSTSLKGKDLQDVTDILGTKSYMSAEEVAEALKEKDPAYYAGVTVENGAVVLPNGSRVFDANGNSALDKDDFNFNAVLKDFQADLQEYTTELAEITAEVNKVKAEITKLNSEESRVRFDLFITEQNNAAEEDRIEREKLEAEEAEAQRLRDEEEKLLEQQQAPKVLAQRKN